MTLPLPIILIHRGNSWYLPYTIWQCKVTNPQSPIYLIGDGGTAHLNGMVNHIDITQYDKDIQTLRSVYKHHSNLGADFELACIERWFILAVFLRQHKLSNALYLDSDILVYDELDSYASRFATHGMTWCSFSAHSNFISNPAALENYCKLVIDIYTDKIPAVLLEKGLYQRVVSGEMKMNISDMTFFHDYDLVYPNSLLAINKYVDEGCFDISMEDTNGVEATGDNFKKITWQDKQPYVTLVGTGKQIPMITLHFQGKGKQVLKDHFKYQSFDFLFQKLRNDFYIFKRKVAR
jgi:hypothetical protein